jgi:hypothetical protein
VKCPDFQLKAPSDVAALMRSLGSGGTECLEKGNLTDEKLRRNVAGRIHLGSFGSQICRVLLVSHFYEQVERSTIGKQ